MMVRLHSVTFLTVPLLAHVRHNLGLVDDSLRVFRHSSELLTAAHEYAVKFCNPIYNVLVLFLSVYHVFEFLDRVQLPILEPDLTIEVKVQSAHLLEKFEDDLVDVIVLFDNEQSLVAHFLLVIPPQTSILKDVEGDLAHLNGLQFGRLGVVRGTTEAISVARVKILALNDVLLVLIELFIQVVEVNGLNVNLVDVRSIRVTSRHTNPVLARKSLELLTVDARRPAVGVTELVVRHVHTTLFGELHLDVEASTTEVSHDAMVVGSSCRKMAKKLVSNECMMLCLLTQIGHGHIDGETAEALVDDGLDTPDTVVLEHEDADTVEVGLVAEVVLHLSGTGRIIEGPHDVALDVTVHDFSVRVASALSLIALVRVVPGLHVDLVNDLILVGLDGL